MSIDLFCLFAKYYQRISFNKIQINNIFSTNFFNIVFILAFIIIRFKYIIFHHQRCMYFHVKKIRKYAYFP